VVDVAAFTADVDALAQIGRHEAHAEFAVAGEFVAIIREDVVIDAAATDHHERRDRLGDAIAEGVDQVQTCARTVEVGAGVVTGFDDVAEQRELPTQTAGAVLAIDRLEAATLVVAQVALVVANDGGVLEQIAAHHTDV